MKRCPLCFTSNIWLICVLWQASSTNGEGYVWKTKEKYYFSSIYEKLNEITIGDCTKKYKITQNGTLDMPLTSSEIYVASIPAESDIVKFWKSIQKPKQMRVEPFLCANVYAKKLPIFNNTGCQLPSYMSPSAPRCQTKYLRWICERSQIDIYDETPNHFVIPEADHSTTLIPPTPYIVTAKDSFVSMCGQISTSCGVIHTNANCMATGYKSQAVQFGKSCPMSLLQENTTCTFPSLWCDQKIKNFTVGDTVQCAKNTPFGQFATFYTRVFVVAEVDDTYVYHIHLEIMPRILYHLDFLLANPDIKILIGCDTKKGKGGTDAGLRQGIQAITPLMTLAGLSMDRLIVHQHVIASEIYLPMEGGCQDPVYNTWQILTMRKLFFQKLGLFDGTRVSLNKNGDSGVQSTSKSPISGVQSDDLVSTSGSITTGGNNKNNKRRLTDDSISNRSSSGDVAVAAAAVSVVKPVMMLLKRSSGAKHTRNRFDLVRQWSEPFTQQIMGNLTQWFPTYNVVLYSDKNETLMKCYECQIKAFAQSDVLIGVHGAGLSNMLYMKPNSAVVEIAPYGNDGRCLLGGGPFSRTAAVMSHNYMMHHSPYDEFIWNSKDLTSEFNITRLMVHVKSFLKSIDFV